MIIGKSELTNPKHDNIRTAAFLLPTYRSDLFRKPPYIIEELFSLLCAVRQVGQYSNIYNRYMMERVKPHDIIKGFSKRNGSLIQACFFMKIGWRDKQKKQLKRDIQMERELE